jgi:hypothetical protein
VQEILRVDIPRIAAFVVFLVLWLSVLLCVIFVLWKIRYRAACNWHCGGGPNENSGGCNNSGGSMSDGCCSYWVHCDTSQDACCENCQGTGDSDYIRTGKMLSFNFCWIWVKFHLHRMCWFWNNVCVCSYVVIWACLCGTLLVLLSWILGICVGYSLMKTKGNSELFFCMFWNVSFIWISFLCVYWEVLVDGMFNFEVFFLHCTNSRVHKPEMLLLIIPH